MTSLNFERVLVRGANWVGDAVMTLPALSALAESFPGRLSVWSRAWSAPVYEASKLVVRVYREDDFQGLWSQVRILRREHFDLAVLFQNAFSAAVFPALARIPERWGYARDGRGFLLTRAIRPAPLDRQTHEVFYYLNLLE